jgi:hypothetical protein
MRVVILIRGVLFVTLIALACTATGIYAEEEGNPLDENNWALQFGIQRDLTLGSFEAGDISFKQRLSPRSALRYGISLYYSYSGTNGERHMYRNDISVIYQRYVNPDAVAKFYWGMGPYIHFRYSYDLYSRDDRYDERIEELWGVGLYGIGGIEWFVNEVISLHAEYRMSAIYSWETYRLESKSPNAEVRVTTADRGSFNLSNTGSVLFGLSVYF